MEEESKESVQECQINEIDDWKEEYDKRDLKDQAQCISESVVNKGALYLSSLTVAHNASDLKYLGIGYVLTITHDQALSNDIPLIKQSNKLHISINDKVEDETIAAVHKDFPAACKWVNDKLTTMEQNVLVHCSSGISRSASFMIWYLMSNHNMNLQQSFQYVFERRPIILPNDALFAALQSFDKSLFKKLSMNKGDYYAYSLAAMFAVDLSKCQEALRKCNMNVMGAAQLLQQ